MFLLPIKEFLYEVCEQIRYKPIRSQIAEELESHLAESKEHYLEEGMEEKEAEEKAIAQMGEAEKIGKKLNKIHKPKFNWQLFILTIILLEFGFILSIPRAQDNKSTLILLILGMIPCVLIYFWDYKKLKKYSPYLYGIATIILLHAEGRTFLLVGDYIISCASISMVLYVIAFVGFLQSLEKDRILRITVQEREIKVNKIGLISGLSVFSILIFAVVANDIKSVIVLLLSYLIISSVTLLHKKEKKLKAVAILWGSVILSTILLFTFLLVNDGAMREYRVNRFVASFIPEIAPNGEGWQGIEQKKILDKANLFGEVEEVEQSTRALFNVECDSFPLVAMLANYGIVVSILMVIMVLAFNINILLSAKEIKDSYGKLLIIGISSLFLLRSIHCLLMNVNIGIKASFSIPFISSGKIELIIDMICLALIFSVYRRKNIEIVRENRL